MNRVVLGCVIVSMCGAVAVAQQERARVEAYPARIAQAIERGDLAAVQQMVGDVGIRGLGFTDRTDGPLHLAVRHDQLEIARWLIEQGADLNRRGEGGNTPVHLAIETTNLAMLEALLAAGPNLEVGNARGMPPIHYAAALGYVPGLEALLAHGAKRNDRSRDNWTPLHSAVFARQAESVEFLLERGANIQILNSDQRTALDIAAIRGGPNIVEMLLDAGGKAIERDRTSPLEHAAEHGRVDTLQVLLRDVKPIAEEDIPVLERTLFRGVIGNQPGVVRLLIEEGVSVEATGPAGVTALQFAAEHGFEEMVRILIRLGANVSARHQASNWSSVHFAALGGQPEIIRLLQSSGADLKHRDYFGRTPLHVAVADRNPATVDLLLQLGSDVNAQDGMGNTPLHLAATWAEQPLIKSLLDHGADASIRNHARLRPGDVAHRTGRLEIARLLLPSDTPGLGWVESPVQMRRQHALVENGRVDRIRELPLSFRAFNDVGNTPLHEAAATEQLEVMKVLVEEKDIEADIRSKSGYQPLHLASEHGFLEGVAYLLERGSAVNDQRNISGWTPLHFAVYRDHRQVVDALLNAGASPNLADGRGWTPMHVAGATGNAELLELLKGYGGDDTLAAVSGETPASLSTGE